MEQRAAVAGGGRAERGGGEPARGRERAVEGRRKSRPGHQAAMAAAGGDGRAGDRASQRRNERRARAQDASDRVGVETLVRMRFFF